MNDTVDSQYCKAATQEELQAFIQAGECPKEDAFKKNIREATRLLKGLESDENSHFECTKGEHATVVDCRAADRREKSETGATHIYHFVTDPALPERFITKIEPPVAKAKEDTKNQDPCPLDKVAPGIFHVFKVTRARSRQKECLARLEKAKTAPAATETQPTEDAKKK